MQKYKGQYKINKYTAWINEASLEMKLSNGRGYERSISIQLIKTS